MVGIDTRIPVSSRLAWKIARNEGSWGLTEAGGGREEGEDRAKIEIQSYGHILEILGRVRVSLAAECDAHVARARALFGKNEILRGSLSGAVKKIVTKGS